MVDEDERIDLVESSAAAAAELLLRPATVETTDKPSLRVVIVAEKKNSKCYQYLRKKNII